MIHENSERYTIRSDEGLTLETSAFQSLYGGQFTLSTQLINQNFCDDSSLLETQFKLVAGAAVSVVSDKEPWLKEYQLTRLQQIFRRSRRHHFIGCRHLSGHSDIQRALDL